MDWVTKLDYWNGIFWVFSFIFYILTYRVMLFQYNETTILYQYRTVYQNQISLGTNLCDSYLIGTFLTILLQSCSPGRQLYT